MKFYGIQTRNCAGTIIYVISGKYANREEAFEAAKKGFRWFALDPNINDIVLIV